MSRTDSRDSTTSTFSATSLDNYYHSTSPSWSQLQRPGSSSSASAIMMERRDSSSSTSSAHREYNVSGWLPSPFRSCQMNRSLSVTSEPSSYISDDDLLSLSSPTDGPSDFHKQQEESSMPSRPPSRELTTEEQIEIIRAQRQREDAALAFARQQQEAQRKQTRVVRFAGERTSTATPERRPSSGATVTGPVVTAKRPSQALKRRSAAARRNLALVS